MQPGEIRALSLRIFDRSFAVTYVLEIAAILIGMIGVAATFSAQAITRTREFGMLRHMGVTRGQVLRSARPGGRAGHRATRCSSAWRPACWCRWC